MVLREDFEGFLVYCYLKHRSVSDTVHAVIRILDRKRKEWEKAASVPLVWVCERAATRAVVPLRRAEAMVMLAIYRQIYKIHAIGENKVIATKGELLRLCTFYELTFDSKRLPGNLATHHGSNHVMIDLEEAGTVSILSSPVHHHSSFIRRNANIMTYNARLD